MASATVKNEYHHHWPNSIFPQTASSPSPSPHFQDYSGSGTNTMNNMNSWSEQTPPPLLNTLSPLSTFMDEDSIISMSSLDCNTSFHASGLTSEEMEEEQQGTSASPFMNFSSLSAPYATPGVTTSTGSNSSYYASQPEDKVLLQSVMKSRLESLETVLLGDDYEPSDDDSSTASPSHNSVALLQDDTTATHQPEFQQQMPPPPPQQSYVQPAQESLRTIRTLDFHQPTFASWTSYSSAPCGWQDVPPVVQPAVHQPAVWHMSGIPSPTPIYHEDPQVMLVHMLVMCAHAVAEDDLQTTNVMLARLRGLTSPSGTPMQRLATYFAEALAARTDYHADRRSTSSALFRGLVSDKLLQSDDSTQASMLEAFSTFYDYLPIGKFDHLTMNQVILDTVERDRAIHILDLQLWFGTQWPALLQALATRPGGPPRVRITAVGTSLADLKATGAKLKDCAKTLRVHLDYHELLLTNLLEDFHAGRVGLRPGETFIVNSLSQFHYLLAGDTAPTFSSDSAITNTDSTSESKFASFLRQIRSLRPKVLVMAENDASHNSPHFLKRFGECLKYYSAVFDAMATCASSPTGRLKMERLFAAPKIRNIIACEGPDRVERHESMSDWSKRLESAGFRSLALSQKAINQAKLLLRLYYTNGYTLHNEKGYLVLGWRNLPLNTVSAWRLG